MGRSTVSRDADTGGHLRRVMGVPGLVVFGLAYMAPLAVFTLYGVVFAQTRGHVPGAYLVTLAAMLFTAASYASLVAAHPQAGSAYTYARRAFGGHLGFLTGWALMLDYLLIPLTNYLLIGIYLNAEFPSVAGPVWALIGIVVVTTLSVVGIGVVRNANLLLVGMQVAFVAIFAVLAITHVVRDPGSSILQPLFDSGLSVSALAGGAASLALSFLGFDAISAMSEEARDPRRTVPRAIIASVLIGGLLFVVVSYVATTVEPDYTKITNPDSAPYQIMGIAAGHWLQTLFLICYLAACTASALASQVSVTRILYAMGRDGVLPRRVFGWVHRRYGTPVGAVLFVGAISLIALFADLATMASIVSFGALAAFSVVNLAVVKNFVIDGRQRSAAALLKYGLAPLIGFALTAYLWSSLSRLALIVGLVWLGVGAVYLAGLTRGFRDAPPEVRFDADTAPDEGQSDDRHVDPSRSQPEPA